MTSDNLERVALIERLRGRARYLRNLGEIKSPELMEDAAVALSAIPVPSPMGEERVTQADRDAAADIAGIVERMCLGGNDIAAIRNGVWDTDGEIAELVQFVHSFRIRAIQAAVAEEREWCAQVADAKYGEDDGWHTFYRQAGNNIATAIRKGVA